MRKETSVSKIAGQWQIISNEGISDLSTITFPGNFPLTGSIVFNDRVFRTEFSKRNIVSYIVPHTSDFYNRWLAIVPSSNITSVTMAMCRFFRTVEQAKEHCDDELINRGWKLITDRHTVML